VQAHDLPASLPRTIAVQPRSRLERNWALLKTQFHRLALDSWLGLSNAQAFFENRALMPWPRLHDSWG
jgi:hypothetical protein